MPAGLLQLWLVVEAPHTAESVGVHDWVCVPEPEQKTLETVSPKLFLQTPVRDCDPLLAVKLQVALRVCVPVPLHTADALQVPQLP